MAKVILYYITCGAATDIPDTVILASTDYAAVTARRDRLESLTGQGVCTQPHPIRNKEVTLGC